VRMAQAYTNFSTRLDSETGARLNRVRDMTGLSGRELIALFSANWETSALPLLTEKERELYVAGGLTPSQIRKIRARIFAAEGVS
jgi:hypothetical protein